MFVYKLYLPLNGPFRCLSSLLSPGLWRRSALASEVTLCNQLTCSSWCGNSQGGSSSSWAWQPPFKPQIIKNSVSGPTLVSEAECFKIEGCIDGAGGPGDLGPPQRWDSYTRACHCKVRIKSQTMVLPLFTSIQLDHLVSGSRDWQRRLTRTVRTGTLSSSRGYR